MLRPPRTLRHKDTGAWINRVTRESNLAVGIERGLVGGRMPCEEIKIDTLRGLHDRTAI